MGVLVSKHQRGTEAYIHWTLGALKRPILGDQEHCLRKLSNLYTFGTDISFETFLIFLIFLDFGDYYCRVLMSQSCCLPSWCHIYIYKGLYRGPLEEQFVEWGCKLFSCAQRLWAYLCLSVPNELILLDLSLFTVCTDAIVSVYRDLVSCLFVCLKWGRQSDLLNL